VKTNVPLLALIGCSVLWLMTSCSGRSPTKAELVSPTGEYVAVLSEADHGGTGGWASVVRVEESFPSLWTRLLGREGDTVFEADLRSSVLRFDWTTKYDLIVMCSPCDEGRIRLHKTAWRAVTIAYEIDSDSR